MSQQTWYVFVNQSTGAAAISTSNKITAQVLRVIKAKSPKDVAVHSFTGSFSDAVDQAFGDLGLAGDQLATVFKPIAGSNVMALAGPTSSAPFNTGSPLSPNFTHSQAQSIDQTANSFLNLSGWAQLLVRVLEGLVGVALIFLGLQALTGTGGQGNPVKTVKRYA
jgi:hypothetical protein